jgi:hypothetical protein
MQDRRVHKRRPHVWLQDRSCRRRVLPGKDSRSGGLDINNPVRQDHQRSVPGQFCDLHRLALMSLGVQRIDPALDAGVDFSRDFAVAKATRAERR